MTPEKLAEMTDFRTDYKRADRIAQRRLDDEDFPPPPFEHVTGELILDIPEPDELVAGRFTAGSFILFAAESGCFKTFLVTDLGLTFSSGGRCWLGARVSERALRVAYCLAEGFGFYKYRVRAWLQEHDVGKVSDHFAVSKSKLNPLSEASVSAFIEHWRPWKPDVVVLDTWSRHGGPESDENDMRTAIAAIDRVRAELECTVIAIVHIPKDGRQTPRGHGSIDGAADTVAHVKKLASGLVEVRLEQRDLEDSTFNVRMKRIELTPQNPREMSSPRSSLVPELATKEDTTTAVRADEDELDALVLQVMLDPEATSKKKIRALVGRKLSVVSAAVDRLTAKKLAKEGAQGKPYVLSPEALAIARGNREPGGNPREPGSTPKREPEREPDSLSRVGSRFPPEPSREREPGEDDAAPF